MTTETTERPEVADEVVDRAEIRDGRAVVTFGRTERALAELRERYGAAKFDVTTTAGDKAARAARLELVTLRAALEKRRTEFKAPALEFGKLIDSEAKRITAAILAIEGPIDTIIKAEEQRKADEKARREREEVLRRATLQRMLDEIRAAATGHAAAPAAQIAEAITAVAALDVSEARFAEFAPAAQQAQADTLDTLRRLHAGAVEREAEAARLAAERRALAIQQAIDRIAALPTTVAGKSAAALRTAIAALDGMTLKAETFGDRLPDAENARLSALATMGDMLAAAARAEQQAEELAEQARQQEAERMRLANERAAAELRVAVDRAFDAAVNRVGYERARQLRDAYAPDGHGALSTDCDDYIAALNALQVEPPPAPPPAEPMAAAPAPAEPLPPAVEASAGVVGAMDATSDVRAAPEAEEPKVMLGVLCERWGPGFKMTAAFVETALHESPLPHPRSTIYTEAQVAAMCERLIEVTQRVRAGALLAAAGVQR